MSWFRIILCRPLAAALALALAHAPAAAQTPCMERTALGDHLARVYGERPAGSGIAGGAQLIEIFAGASGSWTLVVTTPDGRACVAAVGEAWQMLPAAPPDDGARS